MRKFYIIISVAMLSGCTQWALSDSDATSLNSVTTVKLDQYLKAAQTRVDAITSKGTKIDNSILVSAACVMPKSDMTTFDDGTIKAFLGDLATTKAMKSAVSIFSAARPAEALASAPQSDSLSLSYNDFKALYDTAKDQLIDKGAFFYGNAYVHGTFVSRFGDKWAKPTKIDDTAVANFVALALEYLADRKLQTPIIVNNVVKPTKYYPAGKAKPTAALAGEKLATDGPWPHQVQVAASAQDCGISEAKANLMMLLSKQASMAAGGGTHSLIRSVGAVNLGAFVVPEVLIGLNDPIRNTAVTFVETVVRRSTEHVATEALWQIKMDLPDSDE